MAEEPSISLQLGRKTVPFSSPPAEIMALVNGYNRRRHIEGLPDGLNPATIDPDKAAGLVAGLHAQPPAVLARLAGNALLLDWASLGLGTTAPTHREAFAGKFDLIVENIRIGQVMAHTSVPFDPQRARAKAAEAQSALTKANADVIAAEGRQPPTPNEVGDMRFRRSAIAQTWLNNAEAWAKAEPSDGAAQSSLTAANKAFDAYHMPKGIE